MPTDPIREATHIARGPGGYVLPLREQPWFDGARTPKAPIRAWEQANREDWKRFDAWLRKEREGEEKSAAKWRTFVIVAWFLACILLVVSR